MPRIFVLKDSKFYKEIYFKDTVSIGREVTGNDLVLDLETVSKEHAQILQSKNKKEYLLSDLASKNHTFVDKKPISKYRLSHGLSFQIADYTLIFLNDDDKSTNVSKVKTSRRIPMAENGQPTSLTVLNVSIPKKTGENSRINPKERLQLILSMSSELNLTGDYHEIIKNILYISTKVMNAKRGFLALKDESGVLNYSGMVGFPGQGKNLCLSQTMIQRVVNDGESILTKDAVRENGSPSRSVLAYKLKSVMCVPLKILNDIMGCIYIDNPDQTGSFTQDDLDFLTILAHQVAIVVENARLSKQLFEERGLLEKKFKLPDEIFLKSEKMMFLYQRIQKVAKTKIPVLIMGETGTGKEFVARSIHKMSGRKGNFVTLNCSAIPKELFESELFGHKKGAFTHATEDKEGLLAAAADGTIFLDEIGEMSPLLQPKLLRFLQDKMVMPVGSTKSFPVDVRVVSATNRDLDDMISANVFRKDLFYRLRGVSLQTYPLRERKGDIPILADFLIQKICDENDLNDIKISKSAMETLKSYEWPGNINDLRSAIQKACVFGDGQEILPNDLPEELQKVHSKSSITSPKLKDEDADSPKLKDEDADSPKLKDAEMLHILKILRECKGNKAQTAKLLGISRDTIYRKLKTYGLYKETKDKK